jgi:uncharacterized protein (TIGR02594 family)
MRLFKIAAVMFALVYSGAAFANDSVYITANTFIGMNEHKNRKTLRQVTKVDPVKTPWCAAFVNGVLNLMGLPGTGSNTAKSFTKYKQGTTSPEKGDIVVLRRKGGSGAHVGIFNGFVVRNGKKMVAVLGGNQSNKVSVAYYPTSKVITYRRVA